MLMSGSLRVFSFFCTVVRLLACEFACETDSTCDYNCLALQMRERGEGASRRHSVRLGLWRCSLERWQVLQCVVHTLDGGEVWQQIHLESVGIVHLMWNPPTGSGGALVASVPNKLGRGGRPTGRDTPCHVAAPGLHKEAGATEGGDVGDSV